ncbi:transposase/IS protein [Methylibium sp. T29-B]|nr:transposase/IS protein [Methylibium sp. T29-B]
MRDVTAELKALRLHGMAGAWTDLVAQGGGSGVDSSRWLIEHLLQAEGTDRAMRSVSYQMSAARFPAHRDLAGFDFEASKVDRALIDQLADLSFTEAAHNAVFIGGPGTGKTHLCTALGVAGITRHGKRVRFYSTVDLVNALEREKAEGQGRADCGEPHAHGRGHPGRAGLPAVQPGRWSVAVPPAEQAVRTHQRDDHHQPDLRRMGRCLRRREDDHRAAGPAHASLPHRGDRQRELPLPALQRHGQDAHQAREQARRAKPAPEADPF